MRGIELKHIGVRSFMLKGLTARWGIDGDRPPMPPALRTALVAWYNTEIQRATNFDVIESYAEDFTTSRWLNYNGSRAVVDITAKGVHLTNALTALPFLETEAKKYTPEMVVKVSGVQPGVTGITYRYGSYADLVQITQDGIYTLPAGMPSAEVDGFNGFAATAAFGECDITIEQLPTSKLTDLSGNGHHLYLYGYTGTPTNGINADGWLQSAGVGYGVSYGQPILTDYTVCGTREWINPEDSSTFAGKSKAPGIGAFIFEMYPTTSYSFGNGLFNLPLALNGFSYQSKASYNGTPVAPGAMPDTDTLTVGAIRLNDTRTFHGAYKSFVLFNRTLTTEELAYVRRWMA